jgi:amino-acid N-acetyltransferase
VTTVKRITPAIGFSAAAQKDISAITALLRGADLPHEDFADYLAHFLVVRRGSEIVGAIGYELHGADALLRSLVVAPELRGAGLGGRLVDQLTAAALTQGVKRFFLLTTTAETFFAKRGFQKGDRRSVPAAIAGTKEFNSLCPVSAVCMTRSLEAVREP